MVGIYIYDINQNESHIRSSIPTKLSSTYLVIMSLLQAEHLFCFSSSSSSSLSSSSSSSTYLVIMSLLHAEYGQDGHLYGFSPVCVLWCVERWSLREKTCKRDVYLLSEIESQNHFLSTRHFRILAFCNPAKQFAIFGVFLNRNQKCHHLSTDLARVRLETSVKSHVPEFRLSSSLPSPRSPSSTLS